MNILIINEYKTMGGCEVYVQNLKKMLRKRKHRVFCVYLHADNEDIGENEYNLDISESKINKIIYSPSKCNELKAYIKLNSIELVIVNNVFSQPITIYRAIGLKKTIQIFHDYNVVCPKSTCIKDDGSVCRGYKHEFCLKECTYRESKSYLLLKFLVMKISDRYRKNSRWYYISPSERLKKYAINNGYYSTACIPNPLNMEAVSDNVFVGKIRQKIRKYIYVGGLNKNKGLYVLLPAFEKFARDKNIILELYGRPSTKDDELFIKKYCGRKIIYRGHVKNEDIQGAIREAYGLIVPSYWMDNYPTTILEGFINKTLVIGSNRGGIPEMLKGRGICFDYGVNGLINALNKLEDMDLETYKNMTNSGMKYVIENNKESVYMERFSEYLNDVVLNKM